MRTHRVGGRRATALAALAALAVLVLAGHAAAADSRGRDIFDYDGQKAAQGVKKIVFIADTAAHGGRGNHEFLAGAMYFARVLNEQYPGVHATVYTKGKWPKDLTHADTVIVLLNHGGSAADNPAVQEAVAKGAGFMAIHYAVEVTKGKQGNNYLKWLGGYFETEWSVNPFWTPKFKDVPAHEVSHGVKPFSINDEWYYHMRFVDGMKGVTPILADVPPLSTVGGGGKTTSSHGGNPHAYADVAAGKKQVVAWAYERPDGGRGFGFTGLHKHHNLGDDDFRTLLLNACAWVAKLPVPRTGVLSRPLDRGALESLIDDAQLAVKRRGI